MTNITQQNTKIMAESLNYTRLYKNVAKNTDLNWSEKAILSVILTSQAKGKAFMGTDLQLSRLLDIDQGNVNKYIGQLAKRGIIKKTTQSIASHSGGKPKRRRTILVIELESWIDDSKKPVFTALNEVKKRKPKAISKRKSTKKIKEDLTDALMPADEQSNDSTDNVPVVEDMKQKTAVKASVNDGLIENILRKRLSFSDLTTNTDIAKDLIKKIKKGDQLEVIPALIDLGDGGEPLTDKVIKIKDSNKYFSLERLKSIDSSLDID